MRGKFRASERRVFTSSGYKIAIGVVLAVAVALTLLLLAFLPATEDTIETERKIVSIENTSGPIGVGRDPSKIFFVVTYSDGTEENVSLVNTVYEGLDLTTPGRQNVALSYGDFVHTLELLIQSVDCQLQYSSSLGGKIQGETIQFVPNGGSAATVVAVPETGYVFDCWEDGYKFASRKDTGVVANEHHVASFKKAKYKVRFYYQNGTVATDEDVMFGEKPTQVPNPLTDPEMKIYGYVFSNWAPTDFSVVDRDLNIRPEYRKAATDVLLTIPSDQFGNTMGETDLRLEKFYAHDALATITAKPYNSREFAYWLVQNTDGQMIKVGKNAEVSVPVGISGENLTFQSTVSGSSVQNYTLSFTPNSGIPQIVIQAVFAYSKSDITFINYQNPDNNNVELFVADLPYGKPLGEYNAGGIDFTKGLPQPKSVVGMQFEGWYLQGDASQTVVDGSIMFEQPASLIAKWKRLQYKLIFDYTKENGETGAWHETTVTYQDTFASGSNGGLPATNPKRTSYRFVGWQDALTGQTVDDRTKLYAETQHMTNGDFVNNKILHIVPVWEPIAHTLSVQNEGGGSFELIINEGKTDTDGNSLEERKNIYGEMTIYENNSYKLSAKALNGYVVNMVTRSYPGENEIKTDNYTGMNLTNVDIPVVKTSDNAIKVVFAVKKIMIRVTNGDASYFGGLVAFDDHVYAGAEILLESAFNATAVLRFISMNAAYSIRDVIVDGKSLGSGSLGEGKQEYTLNLPALLDDVEIAVVYSAKKYTVSWNLSSGGTITKFNPFNSAYQSRVNDTEEFTHGEDVFYRINATDNATIRNILSALRVNGSALSLQANTTQDVHLFNWKINGVDAGITLINVDGIPFFSYGQVNYEGNVYVFCEDEEGYGQVYSVFESGDDVYYANIDELPDYDRIYTYCYEALSVETRSVFNTSTARDMRITSVDIRVKIGRNYNFSASFSPIRYTVQALGDANGTVTTTAKNASFGDSVSAVATPLPGYYVSEYKLGGQEFVPVVTDKKGESFRLDLTNISEDIRVQFIFERITFKIQLVNNSANTYDLFADGVKLNNSLSLDLNYHSSLSIDVVTSINGNYRISAVKRDGDPLTVHYNMTRYTISIADLTEDIIIYFECAPKTNDISASDTVYKVEYNTPDGNAVVSGEYTTCDVRGDNRMYVTAADGHGLSRITVRQKGSFTRTGGRTNGIENVYEMSGESEFEFTINADLFPQDAIVEIVVLTRPNRYSVSTVRTGLGEITGGGLNIDFDSNVEIVVAANPNNYIASFKINGEAVAIPSAGWSDLKYDSGIGRYVSGKYAFTAKQNVYAEAEFALNSYRVTIDPSSVNGKTSVSVNGQYKDEIPHGAYFTVLMTAEDGYHISAIYFNGVKADYKPSSGSENDNRNGSYEYRGKQISGIYTGINEKVTIKVVYEINRYGFTFNIVNASKNFAEDQKSGTMRADYQLSGNRYTGIEHGSNFSLEINPAIAAGYYLSKVKIIYKPAALGEKLVVEHLYSDSDGIVNAKGGIIWFNRFMNFTGSEAGITGDIELIEITFDRNLYTVALTQESGGDTGIASLTYANLNGSNLDVVLPDSDGNIYYYRNGGLYIKENDQFIPSGLRLQYVSNSSGGGRYAYFSRDGREIQLLIEHGLRYSLSVKPTEGYRRTVFTVNGENRNTLVTDNNYAENLVRNTAVVFRYEIIKFTVSFTTSVIAKDASGKIPNDLILNYMDIHIVNLDTGFVARLSDPEYFNKDKLALEFQYGTKLQFIMIPNFGETGYYIYNFFINNEEIIELGDPTQTVTYGGADGSGIRAIDNIEARVSFRIKQYQVTTSIRYIEDQIKGETVNVLREESGGKVAWGDDAYIRVDIGDGYQIYDRNGYGMLVARSDNPNANQQVILHPTDEQLPYLSNQMYYDKRNEVTNEKRDVLVVTNVGGDTHVTVWLEREAHVMRYRFNETATNILETAETSFNDYSNYPKSKVDAIRNQDTSLGYWEGTNIFVLNTRYYDELATVLKPRNGFRILENTALIKAVEYDEATGEWKTMLDNSGNPITVELPLSPLSDGSKRFTFHNETSTVAAMFVKYDLEVSFTVKVKTYSIGTTVNRVNANQSNKNDASVSMAVKDRWGNDIVLSDGTTQTAQLLTVTNFGKVFLSEHHGTIVYMFTAPEGYRLERASVNGMVWNNIKNPLPNDERLNITVDRISNGETILNQYTLTFKINDALVGGYNYVPSNYDIEVALEVAPIEYDVAVYINGEKKNFEVIGTSSGVTDGKTLTILSPQVRTHFSTLGLTVATLEGYEVVGLEVKIGTNDATYDELVNSLFNTGNPSANKNYSIINSLLGSGVDVLADKRTLHIFYTTKILSYSVTATSYAHSQDASLVGSGTTESEVPYDSKAGQMTVYVSTNGQSVSFTNGGQYEYFSTVFVEAYAKEGYKLYSIVEKIDGVWKEVKNGARGISLTVTKQPNGVELYALTYKVNNTGNREFRVVLKQKTQLIVNIYNPYKYTSGQFAIGAMTYSYYTTVEAKENGALIENIAASGNMVVDRYVYDVLVGNRVQLTYKDSYPREQQTDYGFYEYVNGTYVRVSAAVSTEGMPVVSSKELFLINTVFNRITFEKEVNGALNNTGGSVKFNTASAEPGNGTIASAATASTKTVTITVAPNANYVFSNLYVRQRDKDASAKAGYIVFKTGAEEWLSYGTSFHEQDSNGFSIEKSVDRNGNTVFTVLMRGDMELRFEFYRQYELKYGTLYSDRKNVNYSNPSDVNAEVEISNIVNNSYATAGTIGKYFVQYGAGFKLKAPAAPDNYVFMGWYVNGVNTYEYLESGLPVANYATRIFNINAADMAGLIVNNTEVELLELLAIYQPVIQVATINELYYYDDVSKHWNSWETGAVKSEYYNFDGKRVDGLTTTNVLNHTANSYTGIGALDYSALSALVPNGDTDWNLVKKDADRMNIDSSKQVYSKMSRYDVLFQNVQNEEFIRNTWTDSSILFNINASPVSVKFLGWQYYNWYTKSYEDIGYRYEDKSYGTDSSGNYVTVDNTFESYNFALNYLYGGNMPYALSVTNVDNADNTFPLVIRPMFWKVVQLELSQLAYTNELNGQNTDDFKTVIKPRIDSYTNANLFNSISDDETQGEFDYGANVKLLYYTNIGSDGKVINYTQSGTGEIELRYRFIGWSMNWKVGAITAFRFISTDSSLVGINIDLKYDFGTQPPSEAIELRAEYIVQYRQSVYSYNVAGSDRSYLEAKEQGQYSYEDAPNINATIKNTFESFMSYNPVTGTSGIINIQYTIDNIIKESHGYEFFADVGSSYDINVATTEPAADATDIYGERGKFAGYDPKYDFEHSIIIRRGDEESVQEPSLDRYTGGNILVSDNYQLDLQYATKAKITFKNIMFNSGITLPTELANYLNPNINQSFTVWDVDVYGDKVKTPDGTAVIEMSLVAVNNFYGIYSYSLKGFKSGNGLLSDKFIEYYLSRDKQRASGENLFNPKNQTYRRVIEIDYNDGYIFGGSLIFGDLNFSGNRYSAANTGEGTEESPYRIFNVIQFQNIGRYFIANENTCREISMNADGNMVNRQVVFKLFADIKLQNVTNDINGAFNPAGKTKAWVPICHSYDSGSRTHYGFDGILDGNGNQFMVYGLAADDNNLTPKNDPNNPLANFDYAALGGYGIFGAIRYGTVRNLNIGNAYVNMQKFAVDTGKPDYIGILTARAYESDFKNIKFVEHVSDKSGRSNNSSGSVATGTTATGRVFIGAQNSIGAGLLAGYTYNCNIDKVELNVAPQSGVNVDVFAKNAGSVIGYAESDKSEHHFSNITITGAAGSVLFINYKDPNGTNSGGLFGTVKGNTTISNSSIYNISLRVGGKTGNVASGGIVGVMRDGVRILSTRIVSPVATDKTNDAQGIFIWANSSSSIIGDAMASSDEINNTYGKAGGIAGFNLAGTIEGNVGLSTDNKPNILSMALEGVIKISAGSSGGVVGVNAGTTSDFRGLVKGFDFTVGKIIFMMDIEVGSANYGGIAGANLSYGVIDDCSFSGSGNNNTADSTNLSETFLYLYKKVSDADKSYGTVPDPSKGIHAKQRDGYYAQQINAGGIVGFNTASVYNSFTKSARLTVKYENGAPWKNDYEWTLRLGGIVGHFFIAEASSTFDSYRNQLDETPIKGAVTARIQSCYTYNSSIALAGYIWVDNETVTGSLKTANVVGVAMGGIVGTTNDTYYGEAAINTCYTYNTYFRSDIGAYGKNNTSDNMRKDEGDKAYGWYRDATGMAGLTGKYYKVNRMGIPIEWNAYGIVSNLKKHDTASNRRNGYANNVWAYGSKHGSLSWRSLADGTLSKTEEKSNIDSIRGLTYQNPLESHLAMDTNKQPYNSSNGDYMNLFEVFVSNHGGMNLNINGGTLKPSELTTMVGGGFAGMFDNTLKKGTDGRVFKTDYLTGKLLVAHANCTTEYANMITWILDGTVKGDGYLQFYNNKLELNKWLVRGQQTSALAP